MDWVCTECERTYHEVPEQCRVCGSDDLVPAADQRGGSTLPGLGTLYENTLRLVLDPGSLDRSLVRPSSTVDLAFRLLLAVSFVVALALVVGLLL